MNDLHLPWLELSVLVPLLGAGVVSRLRERDGACRLAAVFCGAALALVVGGCWDFLLLQTPQAHDRWDMLAEIAGRDLVRVDHFNAPLLPLVALLYLLVAVATLRAKARRFSFTLMLLSESIALATFSCQDPWTLIALLVLGTLPPYLELRARQKPTRVYLLHMLLFALLLVLGWSIVELEDGRRLYSLAGFLPLVIALLIRNGIAPFHCWVTDLFEHGTFGSTLLYMSPMVGAYAVVRLLLPVGPDVPMRLLGLLSLATAVYAAGMALVQREARRFFCYLFLSHSALVLVGLETASLLGLTGALCLWLSVGLSLTGFGLTLRALEARRGPLSLVGFHGGYEQTPTLAICFLLTGLASIGFPGTFGFMGTELVVDDVVHTYPYVGAVVVIAAALNGIAVLKAYFLLFAGARHLALVELGARKRERWAVLTLATLILGGGLYPQPVVASRRQAAAEILHARQASLVEASAAPRPLRRLSAKPHVAERQPAAVSE